MNRPLEFTNMSRKFFKKTLPFSTWAIVSVWISKKWTRLPTFHLASHRINLAKSEIALSRSTSNVRGKPISSRLCCYLNSNSERSAHRSSVVLPKNHHYVSSEFIRTPKHCSQRNASGMFINQAHISTRPFSNLLSVCAKSLSYRHSNWVSFYAEDVWPSHS